MTYWVSTIILVLLASHLQVIDSSKTKREAQSLADILSSKIKQVPAQEFVLDTIFHQKVDKTNKITQYTIKGEDAPVYERNEIDAGKDVVILTAEEDKIPFKKSKQFYIVLKSIDNPYTYVGTVAIVRDAGPSDKDTVSIDGKNKVIEWRFFDNHFVPGRSHSPLLTAFCSSSMIMNCLFNSSILQPPEKFIKSSHFKHKNSTNSVIEEVEATSLTSDFGDNFDLFYDLEALQQGRNIIGDVLGGGILPGILSGASAILCTALALVGICGHGKGQTDVTVVNESGVPLDPAMIRELMGRRRRRGTDTGAPDYPGWKTQFIVPSKETFEKLEEGLVFYGFGNCPAKKAEESLLKSSNQEDIVHYYRTVLRTDCIYPVELLIDGMLKEKVITVKDKIFEIDSESSYFTRTKIGLSETLMVAAGIELSVFSKTYQEHLSKGPTPPTTMAPDGKRKISKSVSFIVQVILNFLKTVQEKAKNHLAALYKIIFNTVKNIFTKLAQDTQNLEICTECAEDKELNLNGRIYLMALNIFIKHFSVEVAAQGKDFSQAFQTFYKANEPKFEIFVNVYS